MLLNPFTRTPAKIGVIGLGYVGLPLAVGFGRLSATLADDLNTARVLAELHALRKAGDLPALLAGLDLLGIALPAVAAPAVVAPEVERLIAARLDARRAKNFAESDRLRDELAAMGIALKDGKDPATGEPTTSWEVKR